jgi:hypothetical protein
LDNASATSDSGGCADALKACDNRRSNPLHSVATALRAVIEEGFERLRCVPQKIYFNLALFVCAVVIKCANEDIGDRDHENIWRSIISVPALMRSTPCAFAQRMC